MITFKDRTYCASPNCKNECGRKMKQEEQFQLKKSDLPVSYAYFCDIPKEYYEKINNGGE